MLFIYFKLSNENSSSKIDLDDTVTSSPSKIEGARGSMNSPLPLKERVPEGRRSMKTSCFTSHIPHSFL